MTLPVRIRRITVVNVVENITCFTLAIALRHHYHCLICHVAWLRRVRSHVTRVTRPIADAEAATLCFVNSLIVARGTA
ncbi:hypothetical protein THAOC_08938 [Thalassiosira oceanica]|uniref:Uncharacterized protein n=1 Tax=Thalassiosira oceanica TaxID=159749 RepID=K0T8T6_THAOC|nr:hypothetical protein THAOC_08938 [Thalassiosira oceanica]|eukprot:EJK69771.1 hypothetical protein THAOC_08938 [Thalassiosira oceanica]